MSTPAEQMMSQVDPGPGSDFDGSAQEREVFETIVAGLTEHMFGKGKEPILQQLRDSQNLTQTMGEITFALVAEAAHQAEQNGIEVDIDLMMAVATEVIDSLVRMVKALGINNPGDQQMREQALMVAVQSYINNTKFSPEEQAAAQQMLQQMQMSGDVDAGAQELQQMGARAGVDPFAEQQEAAPDQEGPQEDMQEQAPRGAGLMGGM